MVQYMAGDPPESQGTGAKVVNDRSRYLQKIGLS